MGVVYLLFSKSSNNCSISRIINSDSNSSSKKIPIHSIINIDKLLWSILQIKNAYFIAATFTN